MTVLLAALCGALIGWLACYFLKVLPMQSGLQELAEHAAAVSLTPAKINPIWLEESCEAILNPLPPKDTSK